MSIRSADFSEGYLVFLFLFEEPPVDPSLTDFSMPSEVRLAVLTCIISLGLIRPNIPPFYS